MKYDTNHATSTQYGAKHRHSRENGPDTPHIVLPAKAGIQGSRWAAP